MIRAALRLTCFPILALAVGCGGHSPSSSSKGSTSGGSTTTRVNGQLLSQARADHTATLLPSGDVFVAGGVDDAGLPLRSTLLITPTGAVAGPDLSQARAGHTAVYDTTTNAVVLLGGVIDAQGTATTSGEVYDPAAGTVAAGPTLGVARAHAAAYVTAGPSGLVVMLAGGSSSGAYLDSAETVDLAAGTSTPVAGTLPEPQAGARAVLLDTGEALIVSGRGASGPAAASRYAPAGGTFTPLAVQPSAADAAVASLSPSQVLLAGGETAAGPTAACEVYGSGTRTPTASSAVLSEARSGGVTARLTNGAAAVVGGQTATGASAAVEVFDGASSFVAATPMLDARYGHTVTHVGNDRLVVVGGYDVNGVAIPAYEEVDLSALVAGMAPPGTIASYPYYEVFDYGMGEWTNPTVGDDFDWTPHIGTTSSASTGPSDDHLGGGRYVYTESSYPNTNAVAILEGPTFALFTQLEMRFYYHMYSGNTSYPMGTLSVDVSTDGGATWTNDVWTRTGDQGDQWSLATVDLSAYAGGTVKVRFRGSTVSFGSDMAIDEVLVTDVPGSPTPALPPPPPAIPVSLPYSQDFDAGLGEFRDVTGDTFDWTHNSGDTNSLGTGPTTDHTTATSGGTGSYLYTESSSPNTNGLAILEGPSFSGFTSLTLGFWYHMYSDGAYGPMGTLSLDVSTDGGSSWTNDVWTRTGDQGDQWTQASVDLSAYAGQTVQIRFRAATTSYQSDMAIDDFTAQ